ncbi:MAG: peptidoglycan DD-metalloendopeptidase family protein [Candidatus Latescibacteria bacterium]|nr:peptidoglycan DD-metalloendopeptidase family protein [bacterium]MBD3424128.1 peptidoglycan DD-metalloendopeptidase family protein [Candidatus Latescibacterota bacterium]
MSKHFNFLYIRSGNRGVKSIRIPRVLAISALAAAFSLIVFLIIGSIRYAGLARDGIKTARLAEENRLLRKKIERFRAKVATLEKRMENNFDLQNRARMLAGLDPLSRDVWQVGIGGNIAEPSAQRFFSFEQDLDKLVRQSKLQLKSYRKIVDLLEKEKKVRDCTPSVRPLRGGFLSSRFGRRIDPFTGRICLHEGVDYCARAGVPVVCTANGYVTMSRKDGGFGLVVEVNHGNGFKTRYAHLSRALVKRGQHIKRNEVLGLVGNSGRSTGPHLHYEVVFRGVHRNPLHYIIPDDYYFE